MDDMGSGDVGLEEDLGATTDVLGLLDDWATTDAVATTDLLGLLSANKTSLHVGPAAERGGMHPSFRVLVTLSYLLGIAGNAVAMYILCRRRRPARPRGNSKHSVMLCCLVGNDLVALLGMLVLMSMCKLVPKGVLSAYYMCVARVVWRGVGLCSGCVAAVMAMERWLALTHPFLYQKHITLRVIILAILCLWAHVLILVCLPFMGFGLFMENEECVRYRMAKSPKDIAYAYLFFAFGTTLCFCIVWCNLAVVRSLCHIDSHLWRRNRRKPVLRRVSRRSLSSQISKTSTCTRCTIMSENESSNNPTIELEAITLNIKCPPSEDAEHSNGVQPQDRKAKCDESPPVVEKEARAHQPPSRSASQRKCLITSSQHCAAESYTCRSETVNSEEVAFARLMAVLSISFVVCWAPQMISILLAQFSSNSKPIRIFFLLSDLLMSFHFTFDPFIYVVLRHKQGAKRQATRHRCSIPILKILFRQCSNSSQASTEDSEINDFAK